MLESSAQDLAAASAAERRAAEILAHAYLVAQLEQNLIPADEARKTVDDHRASGLETWTRAVHAALIGLRAVQEQGFRLTEDASTGH